MYDVIIVEKKGNKMISNCYHFIGSVTDEVIEQWDRIKKLGNIEDIKILPYSNKRKGDSDV